jgi:hypothetical protein
MNHFVSAVCASLILVCLSFGQSTKPKLPCDFSGELLRDAKGKVVMFSSDEMKRRAVHKVDVSDFMKQADIKGTAIVDALVGPHGQVVCIRGVIGHPIILTEIERALSSWTFESAKAGDHSVAYVGRLEFTLCDISCGDRGINMSLLK